MRAAAGGLDLSRGGPALRLAVPADDDQAMIQYAYLVASQRGPI